MQVLFEAAGLSYQLMNAKASVAENSADNTDWRFFVILLNVPNMLYLPSIYHWRVQRHPFASEFIS